MAEVLSEEQTLVESLTPSDRPNAAKHDGKVRVFQGTYDLSGTAVTNGDQIKLFELPEGYVPISGVLQTPDFGATATIEIGIDGDDNAFRTAATKNNANGEMVITGVGFGAFNAAKVDVILLVAAANAPTSGVVTFQLTCGCAN